MADLLIYDKIDVVSVYLYKNHAYTKLMGF